MFTAEPSNPPDHLEGPQRGHRTTARCPCRGAWRGKSVARRDGAAPLHAGRRRRVGRPADAAQPARHGVRNLHDAVGLPVRRVAELPRPTARVRGALAGLLENAQLAGRHEQDAVVRKGVRMQQPEHENLRRRHAGRDPGNEIVGPLRHRPPPDGLLPQREGGAVDLPDGADAAADLERVPGQGLLHADGRRALGRRQDRRIPARHHVLMPSCWRIVPGQSLLHRGWDGACVLYNDLSGDTHLLSDDAMRLLLALRDGDVGADELAAPELADMLATLRQLHLIEPC
ncbi:HPr-rel-A system PqqD family peptide chaperone [Pseudoduganella flava]|uniref:HPr-rel-A system PqqD family peptide chaperone n=2 Tax=Pseudoduganella flava TaxID=871742 RepID=A0ABX6FT76_9BURK|nr:HPr-rel-A system PqqD family peptide chaperone [Pseudoduganella flava]